MWMRSMHRTTIRLRLFTVSDLRQQTTEWLRNVIGQLDCNLLLNELGTITGTKDERITLTQRMYHQQMLIFRLIQVARSQYTHSFQTKVKYATQLHYMSRCDGRKKKQCQRVRLLQLKTYTTQIVVGTHQQLLMRTHSAGMTQLVGKRLENDGKISWNDLLTTSEVH